jgi:hypothetical protein
MDVLELEPLARMALAAVQRPYPSKVAHVLAGPEEARPPTELTPAFYGSFDWHSAVHGHWALARVARLAPGAAITPAARAALGASLTAEKLDAERRFLEAHPTFEVPYGMAWLLTLCAELREWDDPEARRCIERLLPLETLANQRLVRWATQLSHPVRSGEHAQSAFAMGLALDWADTSGAPDAATALRARAQDFHAGDRDWQLRFEPSGWDFLSPGLGVADLMRRVLPPSGFADWLAQFLPRVPTRTGVVWLPPVGAVDRADGKLVHLDGLLLSRAWMLEGLAAGLPAYDARRQAILAAAETHRAAGLAAAAASQQYEGSHWLGSFAIYLLTGRGLANRGPLT